jgi:type VI secretion system protein ImpA
MGSERFRALLEPIAGVNPCGEDVSELPGYFMLERAVKGSPADPYEPKSEPEPPDWRAVLNLAEELLEKGRHLQVVLWYLHARVDQDGLQGLRDGLCLLRDILERYWDTIYPALDPSDAEPALERVNLLQGLYVGSPRWKEDEETSFAKTLKNTALCEGARLGKLTWRDVLLARGAIAPPKQGQAPDAGQIEGLCREAGPEVLARSLGLLEESVTCVKAIDELLAAKGCGPGEVSSLAELLGEIAEFLRKRGATATALPEPGGNGDAEVEGARVSAAPSPVVRHPGISGQITSREDVLKVFGQVIAWYEKQEPSSPVPDLVKRARRLVGKSFRELAADIAPAAKQTVDDLFGADEAPSQQAESAPSAQP